MNSLLRYVLMLCLWVILPAVGLRGQCPRIHPCPAAQVTICDYSVNDSLLWNDGPYTWSPILLSEDIYEAAANLSIMFTDTCGTAPVVSYTIFFDLEQDNLQETVLTSNMVFPPGKMLYGNAFSIDYLEGDTMTFDKRDFPDSLLYRFALEVSPSGNGWVAVLRWNNLMAPDQYSQARLPEGRHRIVWRVVSGGVTKTCEYNFRVRDCLAPEVYCLQPAAININYDQLAELNILDVLDYGLDNISPENQLMFSMQKAGAGTVFPLNVFNLPFIKLEYSCADTGLQIVDLWVRDLHGNAGFCQASVTVTDTVGFCVVLPVACARAIFGNQDTLDNTVFQLQAGVFTPPFASELFLLSEGCAEVNLAPIPPGATYALVQPVKTDIALNGVSTFDLVLISKHILNVESFQHPWQYLAADVNNSNTVTTFDIALIRKLILGLVDTFPQNTTWRFISSDCVLPPLPLPLACIGNVSFNMPLGSIYPDFNFFGIKMGDINGSALTNSAQSPATPRNMAKLLASDVVSEPGETLEVPFYLDASGYRLGMQLALGVDPSKFEITGLDAPNLPGFDASCWTYNNQSGALALSWAVPVPHALLPDAPAFVLHLRARSAASLRESVQLNNQRLQAETYQADGEKQNLLLTFEAPQQALLVKAQPNPSQGGASWPLRLNQSGPVQLDLFDAQGHVRFHLQQTLNHGAHWLAMPNDTSLPPGVYTWRIQSSEATWSGQWVKM